MNNIDEQTIFIDHFFLLLLVKAYVPFGLDKKRFFSFIFVNSKIYREKKAKIDLLLNF